MIASKLFKSLLTGAAAVAFIGTAIAQGTPPNAAKSAPIGAGQQSSQGTPMGVTGTQSGSSATGSTGSTAAGSTSGGSTMSSGTGSTGSGMGTGSTGSGSSMGSSSTSADTSMTPGTSKRSKRMARADRN